MKILLVSMIYDYGDKGRGLALDNYYFAQPLKTMGLDVIHFDFMTTFIEKGKEQMNMDLLELAKNIKPDLVIVVPFTNEFIPEIMNQLKAQTKTIAYYFDDLWRIKYSKFWSKYFSFVTTSDVHGIKRWEEQGCSNFVYSPFGCNANFFKKKSLSKIYTVSFVGSYHPYRAWVFSRLKAAGINVDAFGQGWPNGRVGYDKMVDIFNQSMINLNLSNNESLNLRYIFSGTNAIKNCLSIGKSLTRMVFDKDVKVKEMIKARHFEINACGSFQLSYYVEGLEQHFQIGKEIAIYESIQDMIGKIHYYLNNEVERESIATQGYARIIKFHTMESRFSDLFEAIELKNWKNG